MGPDSRDGGSRQKPWQAQRLPKDGTRHARSPTGALHERMPAGLLCARRRRGGIGPCGGTLRWRERGAQVGEHRIALGGPQLGGRQQPLHQLTLVVLRPAALHRPGGHEEQRKQK